MLFHQTLAEPLHSTAIDMEKFTVRCLCAMTIVLADLDLERPWMSSGASTSPETHMAYFRR